ncbi:asparaginase [Pseudarthrobacter sulfonivorans]|uniref:asparaginase n=1 Tax=Pseudarthrobacter sulfonivorans TaxID=121292 RepID=UPI0028663B08|nr:asparaginase [Pseudarthrobacter sulfonivorans]MDR6416833.1 L-asparaginase II [Pseudarthrobacter sulfonivorans]
MPSPAIPAAQTAASGAVASSTAARGFRPGIDAGDLPQHAPLVVATRGGLVESIHYGSAIATAADGCILASAGDPLAPFYPRSSLKPLQAVAMLRAGLELPAGLLALAAASHSGGAEHRGGTQRILAMHGLAASDLENSTDLPYGTNERESWLRSGLHATQVTQNCSGKHAAMAATCVINGWTVKGYLDPSHPLQQVVAATVADLTGEEPLARSTDGCGTPLFALTLRGMARAFGTIAAAAASTSTSDDGGTAPLAAEAAVGLAMQQHPDMVAGERRDVTELMRLLPGAVAKDGFEGVQLVGLPDGRAVAVKISDGGDRARMPATVHVLESLGVNTAPLAGIGTATVLGGGHEVGLLQSLDFLPAKTLSKPVNEAP